MTPISARVGIARINGERFYQAEAVVDVWADHSIFPESALLELGIEPSCKQTVKLADGSVAHWGYGIALLEIDGRHWPCPVVFSPNDEYRLGASALQIFNMDEDYQAGTLVSAGPLSLGRDDDPNDTEFARLTAVAPLEGYQIWLHYDDGVEGTVDLSQLAEAEAYRRWQDRRFFESVGIGPGGTVEWDDDVALCGDALYLELTRRVI